MSSIKSEKYPIQDEETGKITFIHNIVMLDSITSFQVHDEDGTFKIFAYVEGGAVFFLGTTFDENIANKCIMSLIGILNGDEYIDPNIVMFDMEIVIKMNIEHEKANANNPDVECFEGNINEDNRMFQ